MLAVPTKALLITLGSNPDFLNAKITPKEAEKRENNINFNHGGIVINAKIKIKTNAPIYAPISFGLNLLASLVSFSGTIVLSYFTFIAPSTAGTASGSVRVLLPPF